LFATLELQLVMPIGIPVNKEARHKNEVLYRDLRLSDECGR